ncbi:hypothetical protein C2S52_014339 [Perilla frutescens var. hirtella]|nr:hypothetical protein C2S52_014339 [Perilla frutescens var. hirtella]
MAKKRGRPKKQPVIDADNFHEEGVPLEKKEESFKDHEVIDVDNSPEEGMPLDKKEEAFDDREVEREIAATRALRDAEIEQNRTTLRLLSSYFTKEQLQLPLSQILRESFPNLSLAKTGEDGRYEVKWKDQDGNILEHADERALPAALLRRLSISYPDFSAGISSLAGYEFSNQSVKTSFLGPDKLKIRSLVFDEPSGSQMSELKDDLQTPNINNNRLFVGITPKSKRLPKCGEVLLSVHGSPLGVYKEDNMETIQAYDNLFVKSSLSSYRDRRQLNFESHGSKKTTYLVAFLLKVQA